MRWTALVCILLFFFAFFLQKTNLLASDLGRHIQNGRVILADGQVFTNNRYSYTDPERYAPNHHWLFGVVAAGIESKLGFEALTVLSALLYTSGIGLALHVAYRHTSFSIAVGTALALAPLVTNRFEVRPEAFSLFFFAVELWLLDRWLSGKVKIWKVSALFFLIAALWVNFHIFFSLQILLIGSYGSALLLKKRWLTLRSFIAVPLAVIFGSLINPLGLEGALYPLKIFGEYGYEVAENQTVWFLVTQYFTPHFGFSFFACIFLLLTLVILGVRALRSRLLFPLEVLPVVILTFIFLAMTARMIRFENVLFLVALPVVAYSLKLLTATNSWWSRMTQDKVLFPAIVSTLACVAAIVVVGSSLWLPNARSWGAGLLPNNRASGQFFRDNALTGPIFNNFDVGSYLILELYPQEKVFVDNRAEAYSSAFFEQYRSAQLDEQSWQKLDQKYNFNVIFFFRHESTNWGQAFLVTRFQDRTNWVPVFVDDYALIFLRVKPENEAVIKKFALPESYFTIRK